MRAMSVYDMLMTRYDGREGTMDRNLVSSEGECPINIKIPLLLYLLRSYLQLC